MSADLWVLACGRLAMPFLFSRACMRAMFPSSLSRSTHSAGVSRSHFETPASARRPLWARAATSSEAKPLTEDGT